MASIKVEAQFKRSPPAYLDCFGVQKEPGWLTESGEPRGGPSLEKGTQMPDPGKIEDANLFLVILLVDGPLPQHILKAKAQETGHAYRTVERAKTELGVFPVRKRFGPGSIIYWSLPEFGQVAAASDL